ncbi:hypothetical protein N9C33_03800 [Crocinitomicaceae bacterium]|nr:hypothetical protein [Crocinitomicaceae bacterium]
MKKIKILRIINRFNIGGPSYNVTFLTRFMGDEYETKLVGGLPDAGESDSLHILEKYGVSPILIEELVRQPSISNDRKVWYVFLLIGAFSSILAVAMVNLIQLDLGLPIVLFISYFFFVFAILYRNTIKYTAPKNK